MNGGVYTASYLPTANAGFAPPNIGPLDMLNLSGGAALADLGAAPIPSLGVWALGLLSSLLGLGAMAATGAARRRRDV